MDKKTYILVRWQDSYNTNIKVIDEQHKKLVNLINELYSAFLQRAGREEYGKIITEMIEYTVYHFKAEESLMKLYNFDNLDAHIEEHKKFTQKTFLFKSEYETGKTNLNYQLLNFLRNWLINHICTNDREYIPFMIDKLKDK